MVAVPTGLRRLFTSLLPFLLVFIVVSLLSFYELWSEEVLKSVVSQRKKVAVLYAGPTFHDEVVAALACQLKDADYYTVLYVGSGVHMAGLMLPLSGRRKRGSLEFYGHCVDQWVTITDPLRRVVTDPDLLIFITYPMHIKGFVKDERAFDLLRHHKTTHASSSVVLVTHRVTEMLHALLPDIESLVSRDQLYFLFLGEHTVKSGLASMQRAGKPAIRVFAASPADANNGSTPDTATAATAAAASVLPYKLAHVFPIAPFHYIARLSPDSVPFSSYLAANSIDILVSAVSKLFSGEFTASSTSESEKRGRGTLVFGIQGNLGGKHAHRKNVEATVSCLRGIQEHLAPSSHHRLGLDLIGHISLPFVTGSLAKGSAIHFYNDLSSADYYNQISQLTFMVPAVADAEYLTSRATSSVPAALITGVPVVTSSRFLSIYPCLRDQPVHSRVAAEDECKAMSAASSLSEADLDSMRREVRACSDRLYREAMTVLHSLGRDAKSRREREKAKRTNRK